VKAVGVKISKSYKTHSQPKKIVAILQT